MKNKTKKQIKYTTDKAEESINFRNLLISVASRNLRPENLSIQQKDLLERELGPEWFKKLGYSSDHK